MEQIVNFFRTTPLAYFTILLLVILTIPPIFEKFRLPGLVGLLFAGVVLGNNGLRLLNPESETIHLFSDIGKIYLMFVAGLEIDLLEFKKTRDRSLVFGFSTFIVPLITGILVGRFFGFGWNSAVLIGSLLASHTLLGYPIVNRLGVVNNQAVAVTIGATIFTDIASLFVLAICVSIHLGEFSALSFVGQVITLIVYTALVLFGLDWAGKEYFRRTGDQQSNQFLFVLLAVFIASVGAQIINVDKIVGAFLAGLAVNDVVGHGPVEEKVVFFGSTLFIPCFFIDMGLLLDIPTFIQTIQTDFLLMLGIVGGLILSKLIAAIIPKLIYQYNLDETMTMWSLSLPQVAATLAAALTAFKTLNPQGVSLINESVFNTVIVLMLVTSLLGPLLTAKFARNLSLGKKEIDDYSFDSSLNEIELKPEHNSTVVVPIYNPKKVKNLIAMSAILAGNGSIVPLSVTKARLHLDEPELTDDLNLSNSLLDQARIVGKELSIETKPKIRIDDDIAHAITRTAREENADLIIMGWGKTTGLRARLFGNVLDNVLWSCHCPVAVIQILKEPKSLQRILVPIKNISHQSIQTLNFAGKLAENNQGSLTLLHVYSKGTPPEQLSEFETELKNLLSELKLSIATKVKLIGHHDVAKVILRISESFDLVILRSIRRHTVVGVAMSDVTSEVMQKLNCSLILFGEPSSHS